MGLHFLEFSIGGMHCAACSARIEKVLGDMPEVASAGVSLATDTARVVLARDADPAAASRNIIAAIEKLGFSAEALGPYTVDAAPPGGYSRRVELAVSGMHCAACSSRIERVVGAMPEVKSVSVSLASNTATLELAEGAERDAALAAILAAIGSLGFGAELLAAADGPESPDALSDAARRWEKRSREQQEELDSRKKDLAPAFAFALPLLVLSMGEMMGMPLPAFLSPRYHPFTFALAQLLLCLPVLWSGRRFFLQGIPAFLRRAPNMDSLVALGTGAAFIFSLWNTLTAAWTPVSPAQADPPPVGLWEMLFGAGHAAHGVELYYESAAVVIALVSLGKYLEARSRMRTSEALKGLLDLAPETALRLLPAAGGKDMGTAERRHEEVPVAEVKVGDSLLVRPGSRVPVDGTVLDGASFLDESMLTGESMPVEKKAGDPLAGGTINQRGALVMRAEKIGADTVLARIVRLVQEAQGSKAPIAGMADRVSYYFVPVVMGIALLAGLCWWLLGDSSSFALRIFVSVMVIACPCAMGLATPMAIMVGTGRGAQLGVLFKNGTALEQSSRITVMVFDKTGTLTEGKPALVDIRVLDGGSPDRLLRIAASLENSSEHPLGMALVRAAEDRGLDMYSLDHFHAVPGKGVSGRIRTEAGEVHAAVGNAVFASEHLTRTCQPEGAEGGDGKEAGQGGPKACPTLPPVFLSALSEFAGQGKTPVVLLLDGEPAAVFAIADRLRDDARRSLNAIKDMGIRCIMLTGDNEKTARAIAAEAGLDDVIAGVLPDGKEQAVRALQEEGAVVGMVGDGINDAPALARADVGFAVKSGIDVAVETGDVVLMRSDLFTLVTALGLGRAVMRNIRENLFWAFGYNIVGIPFAAGLFHVFGGPVLSPMLAGAAMALSSVSVVTNSLRLRFFAIKEQK